MKSVKTEQPLRVGLISLGCAKNLVDAEIMLGTLLKDGVEIINDARKADVVIVNTCSFIDSAQEESVDTILESDELRQVRNPKQGLVVSGCLSQRFRDELPKLLPEVDAFMGIDQVGQVTEIVRGALLRRRQRLETKAEAHSKPRGAGKGGKSNRTSGVVANLAKTGAKDDSEGEQAILKVNPRPQFVPDYSTPRFRLTPRHFAYLKIAEGCNHPCSFCIIPSMRGAHRSRPVADVVAEAKALLDNGVKELNLISQDSTYYGLDLRPNHSRAIASPEKFGAAVKSLPAASATLSMLLEQLDALPGDFWIRILYTHPAHWTDELIRTIARCRKVARYVDIPLQHIHQNMLERMRRETSQEYIVDLIQRIRAGIPGIALRTTFIVGFPGETEAYFEALLSFIRETRFERLGVFTYSQEERTRAGSMTGQIPERTRQKRRELAMAAQHEVALQVSESFVGRSIKVLVEKKATPRDLDLARIASWEHGLMRANPLPQPRKENRGVKAEPGPLEPKAGHRFNLVARGEADAPDIDGRVYIRGALPLGEFAEVKVVGHTDYDLIAETKG